MAKGKKPKKNLEPKIFSGLNEDRMKGGGGKFADRVEMKTGSITTVQFLTGPAEFVEIDQHQFRDAGKWRYIPCAGSDCPLCADEDDEVSKVHYRFFANVWDFDKKRVAALEGPKTLSTKILARFRSAKKDGKPSEKVFTSRVYDISKESGAGAVQYDIERNEDRKPMKIDGLKLHDLRQNVIEQFKWAMGSSADTSSITDEMVEDDDEDDDALDDVIYTGKELKKLAKKGKEDELVRIATELGIKPKKIKKMEPEDIVSAILKAQSGT